jgi:hypothetical protein
VRDEHITESIQTDYNRRPGGGVVHSEMSG